MKNSKQKTLAFILSIIMMLGLLAGCSQGGGDSQSSKGESSAGSGTADSAGTESEKESEDEADTAVPSGDPAKLRMIIYGDMTPRREEYFKKDFHDKVLDELNIDMTVEALSWGSNDTVATMLASGENFGVYNIVSAYDWPAKGYLSEITMDQINEHMPNYLDMRGDENGFECVKNNGRIFAIPIGNKPYSGFSQSFEARNDILNEVGFEADDIKTYDQLVEALTAVKAAYPNLRISQGLYSRAVSSAISDTEFMFSTASPIIAIVDEMEEGDKVYSYYETDYFGKYCALAAQWQAEGFLTEDIITNPTQGLADWNAGNCLMIYGSSGAIIDTALKTVAPDADLKLIELESDVPRIKNNDYDWGISISAGGEDDVTDWLRFIDWIYASKENYDFCINGVEGVDYERVDGVVEKLSNDSFWDGWFLEASKYKEFDPTLTQEQIDKYKSFDDGSKLSKMAGFSFDPTNVSAEDAAITAVYDEYIEPMAVGLLDYESNIDDAVERLKKAGIDEYIAEYQKQFSEFYASK